VTIRERDTGLAQLARNLDSAPCQNHLFFRPCLPGDCDNALPAIDLVVLLVLLLRKAADALRATGFDVTRLCAIGLCLMIGCGKQIVDNMTLGIIKVNKRSCEMLIIHH